MTSPKVTGLVILAIGSALILAATFGLGHRSGAAGVHANWSEYRLLIEQTASMHDSAYRRRERELTDQLIEAQNALDSAIKQGNADRDSTIADLHADNLRLRERFRGCGTGGVSENSGTDGSDDGAGASGFSEQDAEFLIRIAAEADAVAHRLDACQSYGRSVAGAQDAKRGESGATQNSRRQLWNQ